MLFDILMRACRLWPEPPFLVVATNLGHSDARMVEKHYGHLASDYIAKEIRKAAPRFDLTSQPTVVPLRGGR